MKRKMSTKKKMSLILTTFLIGALAIVGALAWTDYTQTILNTFNLETDPKVLLHDDFDGENKDVYVENTGTTEIFVRVKFVEYLQFGGESLLPAYGTDSSISTTKADPDDKTTWPTHRFTTDDKVDNKCSLISHDYFIWNMSGNQRAYLAGVYDKDPYGRGGMTEEEFDALQFGVEFEHGDITTKKMNTLDQSDPMMLSEWLLLDEKPEKACWLLDTDGWAYWSAPLATDTATNLLLDSVEPTDLGFYNNGVYHIDVQLQAATLDELHLWYANGTAEIANPNNSIATVTSNGHNFIKYMKGEVITYSWVEVSDSNIYQEVAISSLDESSTPTGNYKLAGHDGILGNDDDNMLAGRSSAKGGGIEIATIDVDSMTYTIKDADPDYVVTVGIDKKLGTYDDVITSKSGNLGNYDITGDNTTDKIGWNYLYGPLNNMLVTTEYVLDNVRYDSTVDAYSYKYADSLAKAKIEEIGTAMGIKATVNTITLDMSDAQSKSDYVWICTNKTHTHSIANCTSFAYASYYTVNAAQADIANTQFFALSITELVTAYGDTSTDANILKYRVAQGASKWLDPVENTSHDNYNYNNTVSWTDGDGNPISTTNYWLRSPGYIGGRAYYLQHTGVIYSVDPTNKRLGVRPACYLDLSTTTTSE